jgi:hypothetical protein
MAAAFQTGWLQVTGHEPELSEPMTQTRLLLASANGHCIGSDPSASASN